MVHVCRDACDAWQAFRLVLEHRKMELRLVYPSIQQGMLAENTAGLQRW
jgi:hypothetical protein